jgi:hypothetical protein
VEKLKAENIESIEWFDDRFYKITIKDIGGEEILHIPSVTTKLGVVSKPFLARWRGDIGNREADARIWEAQEKGIRIHYAWSYYVNGCKIYYNPRKKPLYSTLEMEQIKKENPAIYVLEDQDEMYAMHKLHQFCSILKPKIVRSEFTVYSIKNNDAGTLDNLFEIADGDYMINGAKPIHLDAGFYVGDLKTGNVIDKSAFRQTAAYAYCLEEMGVGPIVGTLIMHTNAKTAKGIQGFSCLHRTRADMDADYKEYRLISKLWEVEHAGDCPKLIELPKILEINK